MADSYLIDGYNLIYALGLIERPLGGKALEHSRRRLFDFFKASFDENETKRITIVFDAAHAPPGVPRQQPVHGMLIRFAPKKQTADDVIETLIDEHPSPRALVVVSNDGRLRQAAERKGARSWTHVDLLDFVEKRQTLTESDAAASADDKGAPMSAEEKEHWRRTFESLESDPELKEFFDIDRFED